MRAVFSDTHPLPPTPPHTHSHTPAAGPGHDDEAAEHDGRRRFPRWWHGAGHGPDGRRADGPPSPPAPAPAPAHGCGWQWHADAAWRWRWRCRAWHASRRHAGTCCWVLPRRRWCSRRRHAVRARDAAGGREPHGHGGAAAAVHGDDAATADDEWSRRRRRRRVPGDGVRVRPAGDAVPTAAAVLLPPDAAAAPARQHVQRREPQQLHGDVIMSLSCMRGGKGRCGLSKLFLLLPAILPEEGETDHGSASPWLEQSPRIGLDWISVYMRHA
ncbi:Putative heavy metal transport/detoxification superfamily protein [Zea mays]|uniref:Putative heavy metal transport/detoxification superfamily protein n=1 Tax=Zea mays TaxID=4577 RepID=A0A1D6IT24_MAIZE|nr:Putative heavy metal transport/detoxification superfamily protein [Zea mays]